MQGIFEYAFGDEFDELESTVMKNLQVDRGIQNVFTPIKDIEKAANFKFSSVLNKDTRKIGVFFNTEFIRYILKTFDEDYLNTIEMTFFYDSQFDKKEVERLCVEYRYKKSIELISIEELNIKNKVEQNLKIILQAMNKKHFDIVFSNPPYNGNLDLKILQELFKVSEKIVFIHPSTFIIDKKFKTNLYNNIRNTNYLDTVYFLSNGNELFGINNFTPLCITIWNMNKKDDICSITDNYYSNTSYKSKINDISIFGNMTNKIVNFKNSIKKYMDDHLGSIHNNRIKSDYSDMTNFSIVYSIIVGSHQKGTGLIKNLSNDFFALVRSNKLVHYIKNDYRWDDKAKHTGYSNWLIWSFKNENERENFVNYCKTKFARFCLSFLKFGQNVHNGEILLIPWLDFTQDWNDAKLCKEFNISEELWNYIDKFIPDYYNDYKSGF